tara:strand:- start:1840 stop:3231 length:1392 start_codon:yes stop_codon:yes gene_type:complete
MRHINNITHKNIKKYSKQFNKKKSNKIFKNVNTKASFKNLILKADYIQNKKQHFKKFISINTKITNQEKSGNCWIYAFLNVIRLPMIKKYKLLNFEFSQAYLFFYDRLEKANTFLNYINSYKKLKLEDDKINFLLYKTTKDGGTWSMFVNLVKKYGLIPKNNMDNNFHVSNSKDLNEFFNNYLLTAAKKIRDSKVNNQKLIKDILYDCYKILVIFLGEPPSKITWEYYEKNDKKNNQSNNIDNQSNNIDNIDNINKIYKVIENVTPIEFLNKYVPYNINDNICLINYPCKSYYKKYNIQLSQNIIGQRKEDYINVPIDILINLIKKSIDNNQAIWCGIDASKFISRKHGIMDKDAFNYKDIFDTDNTLDKCSSLKYKLSYPNHAIMIKGYNLEKGKTNGFFVENSWGEDSGFKGNYFMSLEWFKDYGYEIVIDKKFVNKKILNVLKSKSILLSYNDPFGSLMK